MKNLIVIRHSGEKDRLVFCLKKLKESNIEYIIVEDCYEKQIPKERINRKHFYISKDYLIKNNLHYIKGKTGWTFGDYILYFTREKFKDYDYYWIIDDDLYLNTEIDTFINDYNLYDHDLIAMNFSKSNQEWYWRQTLELDYPESVHAMLFCIARFSSRAIDFLKTKRSNFSPRAKLNGDLIHPNDECFSATLLANNGFKCENLFKNDKRFHPYFSLDDIVFYDELSIDSFNDKVIHPICSKQRGLQKLNFIKSKQSGQYESILFRILNTSGKDFLLSIAPNGINEIQLVTKNLYFFDLLDIFRNFENPFLIKKWVFKKTTMVLDFNYKEYLFALDLKWNGDVEFVARNTFSKDYLNFYLQDSKLLRSGIAIPRLEIIEKYKRHNNTSAKIQFLIDYICTSIDFFIDCKYKIKTNTA